MYGTASTALGARRTRRLVPWPGGPAGRVALAGGAAGIAAVVLAGAVAAVTGGPGLAATTMAGLTAVALAASVLAVVLWRCMPARLADAALVQAYHGPAFVTGPDGRIRVCNPVAAAQFDAAPGLDLGTVLTHLSGQGAGRVTELLAAASTAGSAASDLRTGLGLRALTVLSVGRDRFVWLLDPLAHSGLDVGAHSRLPEFVVDSEGRIVWVNEPLSELTGRVPARIDDVIADPPLRPGQVHSMAGATGAVLVVDGGRTEQGRRFVAAPCDAIAVAGSAIDQFFDALPVALVRMRADGAVTRANRMARELLGHSMNGDVRFDSLVEGLGRSVSAWLGDAVAGCAERRPEVVRATLPDADTYLQVTLHRIRDGEGHGLIALISDATELKTLEAQFVQSQKMQAIGQLAGGVAHDFNNLLTAISGHCDLLLLRHDEGDPDYADLIQIHQNANRAASLVGQLLAFSRKQHLTPERLDLRDTLSDLGHLLNRLVGERVTLVQSHASDLVPVRADRRQLEQVIMNLVVNARDAMPEGGDIRIATRCLTLRDPLRRDRAVVPAGRYVVISIADTGCGIPPDRLSKVFEPFFTTKRPGEGTGLGLSTAYGIVKQTGGFIFAESAPGEGTVFEVLLPALDETVSEAALVPAGPPAARHGEGVVLLVEDEAPVRAFAARALQMRGYRVIEAESGEEALSLLSKPDINVDVFVTDVVMSGLDGPAWVRRARETHPRARVVFISGYAEDALADHRVEFPDAAFLAKPFSLNELSAVVLRQMC